MSPNKRPKSRPDAMGPGGRRPKATQSEPFDDRGLTVTFSLARADREYDGEWTWPDGDEAARLLNFLHSISRNTWQEIDNATYNGAGKYRKRCHKPTSFDGVCDAARERIEALHFDQVFGEFFRFRVDSLTRLWGFRQGGVFYLLWWDPKHRVYPLDGSTS